MGISQRDTTVSKAKIELSQALSDIIERHGLTYGEIFAILASELQGWAKLMVRSERE